MGQFKPVKKRNSKRRAHKKDRPNTINLKLIQTNVDGYTSKKESMCEIADNEKPDIITVNDTALKGTMKVKIPNYFCFSKNREKIKVGLQPLLQSIIRPTQPNLLRAVKEMNILSQGLI